MVRKVDLIRYLPEYLREYQEFEEIFKTENIEIQRLIDETEAIKNLSFVLFCDKNGIERYEKILHITPNDFDSLEARRSRVLMKLNDSLPYTYRELILRLKQLCGEKFSVILLHKIYTLNIVVSLALSGQVTELDLLLKKIIPSNLIVNKKNEILEESSGSIEIAATIVRNKTMIIESVFNPEQIIENSIQIYPALSKHTIHTIKEQD